MKKRKKVRNYSKGAELFDYITGRKIRRATAAEKHASIRQAKSDGGSGVIKFGKKSVYVL